MPNHSEPASPQRPRSQPRRAACSRTRPLATEQPLCPQDERDKLRAQVKAGSQSGSVAEGRLRERDAAIATLRTQCDDATRRVADLEGAARKLRAQAESAQAEYARVTVHCSALDAQLASVQEGAAAAADRASQQVRHAQGPLATAAAAYRVDGPHVDHVLMSAVLEPCAYPFVKMTGLRTGRKCGCTQRRELGTRVA